MRTHFNFWLIWARLLFLAAIFVFLQIGETWGQGQVTHEVSGQAAVANGDFYKARKKAVDQAMKSAVQLTLRQLIGGVEYNARKKELIRLFADAERYIKSYRYIEAVDDAEGMVSRVHLEVTLFPDAVTQTLKGRGIYSKRDTKKKVVILINETSFTSRANASYWDVIPISETSLGQSFVEGGFNVVDRDVVRQTVSEETVLSAIRGNMTDAVNIGLKSGADIVILGNSVSTLAVDDDPKGLNTIQANISLRAISVFKSTLIAAKSDFGSARSREPLAGELDAFGRVGKKLSDFLLSSIRRFWKEGATARQPVRSSGPPLPLGDL